MNDQKRSEIEAKVKKGLTTFTKSFVSGYSAAAVEEAIAAKEGEEEGPELQLEAPEEDTEPIKVGLLTKRGAVRKNWKQRYFVVRHDYIVDYYESEEKKNAGAAPKGSINLAGYEVVTEPNKRKMKVLEEKFKALKIADAIPEYTKYPEFMIECYRNNQRRWLFQCKDQEEFDEWVDVLRVACRKAKGRSETDPVIIAAYDKAFEALRSTLWVPWWKRYEGSEADMLGELMSDDIIRNDLDEVFSKIEGPAKVRMMAVSKIEDAVRSVVGGIVGAGWKAARVGLDKIKPKVQEVAEKGVGPVVEAKGKMEETVTEKTSSQLQPVREKVLQPVAQKILDVAVKPVAAAFKKVWPVVKEKTEAWIQAVKAKGDDLTAGSRSLASSHNDRRALRSVFESLSEISDLIKEALKALAGELGDLAETIISTVLDWIGAVEDALKTLIQNANFTFSKTVTEKSAEGGVDGAATEATKEVEEKTAHDAKVIMTGQIENLLSSVLDVSVKAKALSICEPIVTPLDSMIPDPVKDFISVESVLDEVLSKIVSDLVNQTVGPAMAHIAF